MAIDWSIVTNNIRNSGLNLSKAAVLVGSDWRHMNRLARGEVDEPRFNTGLRILDLHLEKCPEKHNMELITK